MRRVMISAGVAGFMLSLGMGAPAQAGFGAIAYDQYAGKEGVSWDQPSQTKAIEEALRQCDSKDCRVHPVAPKACGALARSDKDQAWGGAERETLAKAKQDAVDHCKTHTETGTCVVRVSGCNK